MTNPTFQLDVLKNESICVFCLSWGKGERHFATVPYPAVLIQSYTDWQRVYLQFYRSKRGRKETGGVVKTMAQTLDSLLEEKRATLIDQFNTWLRDGALTEIRETIAQAAQPSKQGKRHQTSVDLLLACQPLELARLPWEQWSLVNQSERGANRFRLLRTRLNSDHTRPLISPQKRKKVRILVIIGEDDAGGINFRQDFEVIQKQLSGVADLKPVGWTPGQNVTSLKKQIAAAIADTVGWDVLFFAGHSNETKVTGGELAIAPDASLQLSEIQPELETAISQGLQFAFFNSCSGLNIADALIDLGLNQVAVMREPIANTVAQKLLVKFLEHLAQYQDVQDALQSACEYLKSSAERFDYPSAYLVPSLYCQPQSTLFRIQRKGWRRIWESWQPTLPEAVAVGAITILCLMYPLQDFLVERRMLLQAVYRNLTGQLQANKTPPVLYVAIDQESITEAKLGRKVETIDRTYLAKILTKVSLLKPGVVGVDYFLQTTVEDEDPKLAGAIQNAITQNKTWIIFASIKDPIRGETRTINTVADPSLSMQGYINFTRWHIELLPANADCKKTCPFAYLLSLTHTIQEQPGTNLLLPQLQNKSDLRTQLFTRAKKASTENYNVAYLAALRFSPLTQWSQILNDTYEYLDQRWLEPLIDFSIPPSQVYERIFARDLLAKDFQPSKYSHSQRQIVLIAPSGYGAAGVDHAGADNFDVPMAVAYWRGQPKSTADLVLAGGEAHAYMMHHLLSRRLVVSIPDLWMIGVAILLGKGLLLVLNNQSQSELRRSLLIASISTAGYGLVGLQVYISAAILLPWFFPTVVFWSYLLRPIRRAFYE